VHPPGQARQGGQLRPHQEINAIFSLRQFPFEWKLAISAKSLKNTHISIVKVNQALWDPNRCQLKRNPADCQSGWPRFSERIVIGAIQMNISFHFRMEVKLSIYDHKSTVIISGLTRSNSKKLSKFLDDKY
jgi:hypothetical protein